MQTYVKPVGILSLHLAYLDALEMHLIYLKLKKIFKNTNNKLHILF